MYIYYIYMYIYIYIYICTDTCTYVYLYMGLYICKYISQNRLLCSWLSFRQASENVVINIG